MITRNRLIILLVCRNNEMTIYGNKTLTGKFQKLLEMKDGGFIFENREYGWSDITKIKRYDSAFWNLLFYQGGTPRAYIYLKDNKCIKLQGKILQTENEEPTTTFVTGATNAYSELIAIITKNTAHLKKT